MRGSITLELGKFGRESLEGEARTHGLSTRAFVQQAVRYYVAERDSRRPSHRVPGFLDAPGQESAAPWVLEVEMDDETWRAVEEEATRQGVAVDRVVTHAVMYLIADVSSGRVATRLAEGPEPEPG